MSVPANSANNNKSSFYQSIIVPISQSLARVPQHLRNITKRIQEFASTYFTTLATIAVIYLSFKYHKWTWEQAGLFTKDLLFYFLVLTFFGRVMKSAMNGAEAENLGVKGGLGVKLVAEYKNNSPADPLFYRKEELENLVLALSTKQTANACLVGPPGCGKSDTVDLLARLIAKKDPRLPPEAHEWEILSVSARELTAGTKFRGVLEKKISTVIQDLKKDRNLILFIDEAHALMAKHSAGSKDTLADMLKPDLIKNIRIILATTSEEYQDIESDGAFARRFTKIEVSSMDKATTLQLLKESTRIKLQNDYSVTISDTILETVMDLTKNDESCAYPSKATALLDRACARAKQEKRQEVKVQDVKAWVKKALTNPNLQYYS